MTARRTAQRVGMIVLALLALGVPSLPSGLPEAEPQIAFTRLSIEQGLSQSDVYSIHQDKTGFLWFGTEDGLDRYDGTSFVVYRNEILNPASISFNNIKAIYEDLALYESKKNGRNRTTVADMSLRRG